jgi:hypothetical protein
VFSFRNFKVAQYTVAGKAIGFALEQPLHAVAFACPTAGILKQLEYTIDYTLKNHFMLL